MSFLLLLLGAVQVLRNKFWGFSHGHLPEAGREIHIEFEIREEEEEGGGPLAKNQPEASPRAVNQL